MTRELSAKFPALRRAAEATFGLVNETERTCELTFSSDYPVDRWFGTEILEHGPGADLSRLNAGGPVLWMHNLRDQRGVVENASIKDNKGRALVRFSRNPDGEALMKDVQDKIIRNVSFGYRVKEVVITERKDQPDEYRITGWEALEISFVSVPADPTVGTERAADPAAEQFDATIKAETSTIQKISTDPMKRTLFTDATLAAIAAIHRTPDDGGNKIATGAAPTDAERAAQINAVRESETTRIREITAIGKRFGADTEAEAAIKDGKSLDQFRSWVLDNKAAQPAQVRAAENPNTGLNEKEIREFSVLRAINALANGERLSGLEKEASEATMKHTKREFKGIGFMIPHEVAMHRTITAGVAASGGFTVGSHAQGQSLIELLRNAMHIRALGARSLGGLMGDCPIPRQSGGVSAGWGAENNAGGEGTPSFDQLKLTPHRLYAITAYSRQFAAQSSLDAEAFARQELATALALAFDLAAIEGDGANGEPIGIVNTTGVIPLTFGAAPTWAKVVEFETSCETNNSKVQEMAFLATPSVRGKWKTTVKASGTAEYLIDRDNRANGYRFEATNQISTAGQTIFGNFADLILAEWAGIAVIVDPYTQANKGNIVITTDMHADIGIRHPKSFVVSSDSGAQ